MSTDHSLQMSATAASKHPLGPKNEPVSASFTVTWSRVVENGVGMEKIGEIAEQGFVDSELNEAMAKFNSTGATASVLDLNEGLPDGSKHHEHASVLIVHGACAKTFGIDPKLVRDELFSTRWDNKKLMRGQVKNSNARRNMCIAEVAQAPDIVNGKGTVIAWSELPYLSQIRAQLAKYLGCKAEELNAEGNFYHHHQAGIGFHGDAERKIVVAMRFGAPLKLHYQAYHRSEPIGERISIDNLVEGDLYVMGDKATGNDWKRSSIVTWRHAAERFHSKASKYCHSLDKLKDKRAKKRRKISKSV